MEVKVEILLVDDYVLVFEGMWCMLELVFDVRVVDVVILGVKVVELIGEWDYDIYVLDVNFFDILGFDLVDMICEINESVCIIISIMYEEIWIINCLIC